VRIPSGVPGFDALVQGGLPTGASVVVQGPAGKEKDAFLFQFVAEGLRAGGSAVVVLSSLSPAKYQQELREAGIKVDEAIAQDRLKFVDWFSYKEESVQDVEQDGPVYRASIDLANVGIAVSRAIASLPREGEKRAAVEVLSPALSVYDLPMVYGFAQSTKAKLERFGLTSVFVVEKEMHDERTLSSLHQPFDGVIDIERVREGDELVRKIAVLSLKGTAAQSKYVPLDLGADRILRVSAVSERERTLRRQEEMIKSNPKDPKLWLATARNLRGMGENERALKCVEAALNLEPHDPDSWRFKAELLDALGRGDEAQKARDRATQPIVVSPPAPRRDEVVSRLLGVVEPRLRANPRDPDALFVKAAALAKAGDPKGAIEALETLAIVDEAYPGLWVLKAKLHAQRGEREKAQAARRRAQEIEQRLERTAREAQARRERALPPPPVEYECPACGAAVGERDTVCPTCHVVFEGEQETPPPKPRPEVARRGLTNGLAREARRGIGRTNGLVNGTRGRTNGLVNGTRGRTNGVTNGTRGRTNGLVNGTRGRTNGLVNGTRGRTNGLVNGTRGRTNGLVNGTRGRTNGVTNGLVNGLLSLRSGMTNGLTNGSGFTNGLGAHRYAREVRRNRWKIFLIPLVFAALMAAPLLTTERQSGPVVDGAFGDWQGVTRYAVGGVANDTNVDITAVYVQRTSDHAFLRVEVSGTTILAGDATPPGRMDGIYVFVDTDGNAGSGYEIRAIGADRLLEIQGVQGQVNRAVAYRYGPTTDRRDWRGWTDPAAISAASAGNSLELAVDWLLLGEDPATPIFLVASLGWHGGSDFGDLLVGFRSGLVRVTQRHVQGQVLAGTNVPLLAIELMAFDQPVSVSSLSVELLGTAPLAAVGSLQLVDSGGGGTLLGQRIPQATVVDFTFPTVILTPGVTEEWTVAASVSGSSGATLGARIRDSADVGAAGAVVTLVTDTAAEALGYLGQIPAAHVVDGAFAEWTNETADGAGEATTGGNPSIDLDRFGAVFGATNLTFHAAVRGPAFAGTVLTTSTGKPSEGAVAPPDRDRDTVPDGIDQNPDDFDNDGTTDALANGDHDGDGLIDYTFGGPDVWLNTTIPATYPAPYGGRNVTVFIGPVALPPAIGEDRLRLFVDADNVSATGFYVRGIGADYLVEILGREGALSAAVLSSHSGSPGAWAWTVVSDVTAKLGYTQLEALAGIPVLVPAPAFYLEVSDWRLGQDDLGVGTRGGTRSAPVFTGPEAAFVPTSGGAFAYQSTGGALEAYARSSRGTSEEIVLRIGSLFLGWRTQGFGGVGDLLESPSAASVQAAGRTLAIGGFPGAWEQYEVGDGVVKHNVWIASAPATSSEYVALQGELRIPENATVLVDGQPLTGAFATDAPILVEYDGYRVRLEAPFAFESRNPDVRVAGRYEGEVRGTSVRLAMAVPSAWLRDPSRAFPVVLDPTATGIIDTSTSSTPTGGPHQRNVFHDGTYFWAFYYDGSTVQYEPSSDGLTWVNTKNTAFTSASMSRVSVWFHSSGSIVYAVGMAGASTKDATVRRGTISGTTITWGTEGSVAGISGGNEVLIPFIMRDASGYIWVASNTRETGGVFNFAAARSTNTDDVSTWNARTTLMTSIANDFVQGIVLPLGSGDAYAIWYSDGTIRGKRYTASNTTWWTNGDTIDTTTAGVFTKAPSAVVDGSFNVHLVYVDSSGAVKYRQRTTSWSSATTLDASSGNTYATISRDTGTGDLCAFYISSTNQIKGQRYSGSWSSVTLETNTQTKIALTSVYSAGSSANLAWTWSQGSASPYDVKFSVYSTSLTSRTIDTSTDSTPGSYNHQRKVFHDGTYFWAFYFDGSNAVYTYSGDAVTWENAVSQAFTTSAVDNPSVWYHDTGSTKIVYAVGDTSTNDATINVRRGTISGTTITWGTEGSVTLSTFSVPSKVAFVTRDTSGYVWVVSNARASGTTYQVVAARSTSTDDVSTWNAGTNLLTSAITVNQIYPTIVPLTSGDMYALWYADGAIDGKKYTASGSSWGSLENIATTTTGVSTKIPSAVSDGSGNIDLAYVNSTGAVLHKQRTSSWGSATTVDSATGNTSPTITRDTATGDLYVFYVQSTYQIKGRKYSGSWSDLSGIDTSTFTKTYVTSLYSVSAAWKVGWLWGQGGTSPYEVKIARIPEFAEIAIPITIAAGIALLPRLARRSRRFSGRTTS